MNKNIIHIPFLFAIALLLYSCSAKKITGKYYLQHEKVLDKIEQTYRGLYKQNPFSLSFTDKVFRTVSLEFHTDTVNYIYEFLVNEPRMKDSLVKYNINDTGVTQLIDLMHSIHCTWVNNFDYYTDEQKKSLIFISVKPLPFHSFLKPSKYYILTYYSKPQSFDSEGRLLDKRKTHRLRKINGDIFYRINDRVCYTISSQYR